MWRTSEVGKKMINNLDPGLIAAAATTAAAATAATATAATATAQYGVQRGKANKDNSEQ
jgi:hypothetical protein